MHPKKNCRKIFSKRSNTPIQLSFKKESTNHSQSHYLESAVLLNNLPLFSFQFDDDAAP